MQEEIKATTTETLKALFIKAGLDERRALDTTKNEELSKLMFRLIEIAGVLESGTEKTIGNALYTIATKLPNSPHHEILIRYVVERKLDNAEQLKAAINFFTKLAASPLFDVALFEKETGVGVVVDDATVQAVVEKVLEKNKEQLVQQRYSLVGKLLGLLKKEEQLKWCFDRVPSILNSSIEKIVGPKSEEDTKPSKVAAPAAASSASSSLSKKASTVLELKRPEGTYNPIKLIKIAQCEVGSKVTVNAWIHNIRTQSNVFFLELRDGTGFIQCVFAGKLIKTKDANELVRETSIQVLGTISRPPEGAYAKWSGFELQADFWQIIGKSDLDLETKFNKDSKVDVLFDQRHLVIRSEKLSNYLRLRSVITQKIREHFFDNDFVEVIPPTLVQTQAEGGSELFQLKYFEENAYLTQSSQLYLETTLPSVGNSFCLLSSYRAEPSHTRRHLTEYQHLEAEMPFITFDELLQCMENLICDTIQRVLDSPYGKTLREINPNIAVPKRPFKRMDYSDALVWLRENDIKNPEGKFYEFGDDIPELPERKMTDTINEPIFLCRFPVQVKAFYMPKCKEDPRLTESVDLLVPGVGEIIGGSMRIWSYDQLMAAYQREGLDPNPYYWFTDQRKYGSVPHGGYGLGMERLLVWLFGDDHIRNVCLYPRYCGRCQP